MTSKSHKNLTNIQPITNIQPTCRVAFMLGRRTWACKVLHACTNCSINGQGHKYTPAPTPPATVVAPSTAVAQPVSALAVTSVDAATGGADGVSAVL